VVTDGSFKVPDAPAEADMTDVLLYQERGKMAISVSRGFDGHNYDIYAPRVFNYFLNRI